MKHSLFCTFSVISISRTMNLFFTKRTILSQESLIYLNRKIILQKSGHSTTLRKQTTSKTFRSAWHPQPLPKWLFRLLPDLLFRTFIRMLKNSKSGVVLGANPDRHDDFNTRDAVNCLSKTFA